MPHWSDLAVMEPALTGADLDRLASEAAPRFAGLVGRDADGQTVPNRYLLRVRSVRMRFAGGMLGYAWQCRRCGRMLRANAAGAQRHIATHLRPTGPRVRR